MAAASKAQDVALRRVEDSVTQALTTFLADLTVEQVRAIQRTVQRGGRICYGIVQEKHAMRIRARLHSARDHNKSAVLFEAKLRSAEPQRAEGGKLPNGDPNLKSVAVRRHTPRMKRSAENNVPR